MSEWKLKPVNSLGDIVTGSTPQTARKDFYGGDYYLISPAELDNGKYVRSAAKRLTKLGFQQCRALPENAVLVGCIGNVGKLGIVGNDRSATNQQINALVCNSDHDPEFVYYCFHQNRKELERRAVKTTLPILNKTNFGTFEVRVPPLPEQKKIARILSTVQRAIEEQERIIQTTTKLKKALMQKLFTEGLRNESQKQTEIGPIPESWDMVPLGELVNFTTGKLNSNAAIEDGAYPFFTCSKETFWIDHYAFDTEAILLSGNNAQAIYSVKHYEGKFNAYQRTYVITIKDTVRISYRFLSQMLSRSLERLRTISIGSSTKYLTLGLLLNLPVAIPPYADGVKIGHWLNTTDQKIKEHEAKRKTLQDLFRILLHELMTAKTRINSLK